MENTSGEGATSEVPQKIDRWNWGAFLLSWIWGIGNNTRIALLAWVPFVGLAMPFVLGAKGSQWAWRNKRWASVEAFQYVQRRWVAWGVISSVLFAFLMAGGLLFGVVWVREKSLAYQIGLAGALANPQVVQLLGQPVTSGYPTGRTEQRNDGGHAALSIPLRGPHGSGKVLIRVVDMGGWLMVDRSVFVDARSGERIDLRQQDIRGSSEAGQP
jgi:hypothetical protein